MVKTGPKEAGSTGTNLCAPIDLCLRFDLQSQSQKRGREKKCICKPDLSDTRGESVPCIHRKNSLENAFLTGSRARREKP